MEYFFLILAAVVFAFQAIRVRHLISSVLYLAGVSALLSIVLFLIGAQMVAVIELSVGAGLVTVLFVYVINIAGESDPNLDPVIKKWPAWVLVLCTIALLGWYVLPIARLHPAVAEPPLAFTIWQERALDVFVVVFLIFAGVLGLLGLLAEAKAPLKYPMAEEVTARRDKELDAMTERSVEQESL